MEIVNLNEIENEEIEFDEELNDINVVNNIDDNVISDDILINFDFSKIEEIYLDENNMITDEEHAVKRITKYYDSDGNLVQELVSYRSEDTINEEFVTEFTDEQGNVVDEEKAFYAVYKRVLDGQVVNEEKIIIDRSSEKNL